MTVAKAIAAALVALGSSLVIALDDGHISTAEGITGALAVLGSAGVVWYAMNGAGARYVKAVVGAMAAALTVLLVALDDNVITQQEWVSAIVAAIIGLGIVAAVPNAPPSRPKPA
jgi:hypothetical protein